MPNFCVVSAIEHLLDLSIEPCILCNYVYESTISTASVSHTFLVKPSEVWSIRSISQPLSRDVYRLQVHALSCVSSFVVNHHPRAKKERQNDTAASKGSCGNQSWEILWRVFVLEYVRGYYAHEIGQRNTDRGQNDALVLICYVVVIPDICNSRLAAASG